MVRRNALLVTMAIVEALLDNIQSFLHDEGDVWSRDELLRSLNDGYRIFAAQALPIVRIYQLDVPARVTGAGSQEWEDRHVEGTFRRFTTPIQNLHWQGTYRWEAEFLAGSITPTDSYSSSTQEWERPYFDDDVDNHFRFVLARTHEMPRYAFWGDKRLYPRSVTELDLRDQRWWVEAGEPIFYLNGVGRELSFEIFEVDNTYCQAYDLIDYATGTPREFSSDDDRVYGVESEVDRWAYAYSGGQDYLAVSGLGYKFTTLDTGDNYNVTFQWELDFSTAADDEEETYVTTQAWEENLLNADDTFLGLGLLRGIESSDRQYLPMAYDSGDQHLGIPRDFHSSDSSITIFEHTVPVRPLTESDTPGLIPPQLHKYLKYYVLARSYLKPGEGYRPDLAQHWLALYQLGVGIFAVLATPSFSESHLARGQAGEVRTPTPPRVRFPSTYPMVRGGR